MRKSRKFNLLATIVPWRQYQSRYEPLETQIGGDHYTKLTIQPMRYSMENGLDALQHTVIKYVTRFRDKNGIEDLEKARHYIDRLIEFEKESKWQLSFMTERRWQLIASSLKVQQYAG